MDAKTLGAQRAYPSAEGSDNAGLTKREAFAMAALQGLAGVGTHKFETRSVGTRAVLAADELLAALVAETVEYDAQIIPE